eukprot:GSChrysophyteH1.ASY1.ANO1.581.1 assembled CDS
MDLAAVEEVINLSLVGDERTATASQILDTLRASDDRWDIGLQLFFKGSNETAKFFGLSLVRDYLDSTVSLERRKTIRDAMLEWINTMIVIPETEQSTKLTNHLPVFLVNNVASVVTLCVKHDYPEVWPEAFDEIIKLGNSCIGGLDMTVRVLIDLDVEVRGAATATKRHELLHNTAIKDAMRAGDTTRQIVVLLCKSAVYLRSDTNVQQDRGREVCNALSRRCLRCMASFIGWIDVNLVISETLTTLYQSLNDSVLCAPALACLYELVKKGMDPSVKAHMINSIEVVPMLQRVPLGHDAHIDDDEEDDDHVYELGNIVDIIATELLGCWAKFEEATLGDAKGNAPKSEGSQEELKSLRNLALVVASNMHKLMPLLLQVFSHADYENAHTVLPAVSKLLSVLKNRQNNAQEVPSSSATDPSCKYFQVLDYFPTILGNIYRQMQYPEDFDYDPNDEDDAEVMDAKKAVRKVFVNCCRIHAEPCLELILAAFSMLASPISTSAVAPLEAAIQLAYAFAECGPQHASVKVDRGAFPTLINTLHATDIADHSHSYVLLAYFDTAVRYLRIATPQSLDRLAAVLTGPRGLRHPELQVRCRAAYCLLRVTEGLEPKSCILLSHVSAFADIIFNTGTFAIGANDDAVTNKSLLTESAELHLLEATSHIIKPCSTASLASKTGKVWDEATILTGSPEEQEEQQRQLEQQQLAVLHELSSVLVKQIHALLGHADIESHVAEIGDAVSHKISCMASLSKCLVTRLKPEHMSLFEPAAMAVSTACHSLGSLTNVRAKVVVFLHRMVAMLGVNVIDLLGHIYPFLLQYSDATDTDHIVQVLNQALVEFRDRCGGLLDAVFSRTCEKFEDLIRQFEMTQMQNRWVVEQSSNATLNGLGIPVADSAHPPVVTEAPHIDLERASLHRQYVVFLQHVATQGCEAVLLSQSNQHRLEGVLSHLLKAIRGEGLGGQLLTPPDSPSGAGSTGSHEIPRISVQAGLQMRKSAIASLVGLAKAWDPGALQDSHRAASVSPQL